jgi:hypothetical protein
LGGHAIAVDRALLALLQTLDLVGDKDIAASQVPGLERAIPKNKGPEFFSLAHQLSAALFASPFNIELRNMVIEVDSQARNRFPKRGTKRTEAPPAQSPTPTPPPLPSPVKKGKPAAETVEPSKKKPAAESKKKVAAGKKPYGKPPRRAPAKPDRNPKKTRAKGPSASKQLARKKPR